MGSFAFYILHLTTNTAYNSFLVIIKLFLHLKYYMSEFALFNSQVCIYIYILAWVLYLVRSE